MTINEEFDLVTDWLVNLEEAGADDVGPFVQKPLRHLGPILELARSLADRERKPIGSVSLPFRSHTTNHLESTSSVSHQVSVINSVGAVGFASFASNNSVELQDGLSLEFVAHTVDSCTEIGIPRKLSQAAAGAMEEMINNALRHSLRPATAVVGFRAERRRFEFAVLDAGIGILESLRQSSEYGHLADEEDALELSITDGVSRHGSNTGHGMGFREIFSMPNNHAGHLWLHSGSNALVVGNGTLDRTVSQVRQVHAAPGVLVAVSFGL